MKALSCCYLHTWTTFPKASREALIFVASLSRRPSACDLLILSDPELQESSILVMSDVLYIKTLFRSNAEIPAKSTTVSKPVVCFTWTNAGCSFFSSTSPLASRGRLSIFILITQCDLRNGLPIYTHESKLPPYPKQHQWLSILQSKYRNIFQTASVFAAYLELALFICVSA